MKSGTPRKKGLATKFFEHVIRNEEDFNQFRENDFENPARWGEDEKNPKNLTPDPRRVPQTSGEFERA